MSQEQAIIAQLSEAVASLQHQLNVMEQQQAQATRTLEVASRSTQLRVPKPDTYDGKGNIRSWVWTVEQYFAITNVYDDKHRTQYVVNLLRGNAATWMRSMVGNSNLPSWTELRDAMIETFAPISEVDVARDKLAQLTQKTSVPVYVKEFRRHLLLIPNLPEDEQIDKFVRGLKLNIAREIRLRDPQTLKDAIIMAERYDSISWQLRSRSDSRSQVNRPSKVTNHSSGGDAMDLSTVRFKKLTDSERQNIMRNNGCLFCRKLNTNHRASNCPAKKPNKSSN